MPISSHRQLPCLTNPLVVADATNVTGVMKRAVDSNPRMEATYVDLLCPAI